MPDKITVEQLERAHACPEGIDAFIRAFGRVWKVNVDEAAKHASAIDLDLGWAAGTLLAERREWEITKRIAGDQLDQAIAAASRQWSATVESGQWSAELLSSEYTRVTNTAMAEYHKLLAIRFAELYLKQKEF